MTCQAQTTKTRNGIKFLLLASQTPIVITFTSKLATPTCSTLKIILDKLTPHLTHINFTAVHYSASHDVTKQYCRLW